MYVWVRVLGKYACSLCTLYTGSRSNVEFSVAGGIFFDRVKSFPDAFFVHSRLKFAMSKNGFSIQKSIIEFWFLKISVN